jgi:hypothetical protein
MQVATWRVLVAAAGAEAIVVEGPAAHTVVWSLGGHPVPFESPQFAAALDPAPEPAEAFRRLRAAGIRFITFTPGNPVSVSFFSRHRALAALVGGYPPVAVNHGMMIFDLASLGPAAARAP